MDDFPFAMLSMFFNGDEPRLLFGISTAHHTDHAAVAEGGELSRLGMTSSIKALSIKAINEIIDWLVVQ